jgi:hypothetical protein
MFSNRFWIAMIGCFGLLMIDGWETHGQGKGSSVPQETMDHLRNRYRRLQDDLKELSVKWVMTFELHVNPMIAAQIDGYQGEGDSIVEVHAAFKDSKLLYDQRYRFSSAKPPPLPDGFMKRTAVAYDGQTTQLYKEWWNEKPGQDKWVRLTSGNTTNQFGARDEYMACHGLPRVSFNMLSDESEKVPIDLTKLLGEGAYQIDPNIQSAADGTPCIVVKGGRDRIWFDPKLNLAIRQREWQHTKSPGPVLRVRLADYVEFAPKTWLAKTVYMDFFCDPDKYPMQAGRPYKTGVLRVTELKVGSVPDSLFRLKLEPGMDIEDATRFSRTPDGTLPIVNYTIPANPADLANIIQEATEARAQVEYTLARQARFRRWFLVGNVVVVCVLVALWLYRHYKDRRAAGSSGAGSVSDLPRD